MKSWSLTNPVSKFTASFLEAGGCEDVVAMETIHSLHLMIVNQCNIAN